MSFSVDVLNSSLQHLLPKYEELFLEGHPVIDAVLKRTGLETIQGKGPYMEFTVLKGHPGRATGIRTGNERLASTRKNNALRGNQYAYRCIYHWDVPRKDLAECSGANDFARIIDDYPTNALAGHMQAFARQFASGTASAASDPDGTDLDGFLTLNGLQDYNPQGTARDGVFQPLATGAQTNTVFGLPMSGAGSSPTPGWEHQFEDIGSFSLQGVSTIRKLVTRANQSGHQVEGSGIDVMLADEATFQNYIDTLDQRAIVNDDLKNLSMKYGNRAGVPCGQAIMWWEPAIDLSDTAAWTGVTQDGVLFMLNTSYWAMFQLANNSKMAGKGFFDLQDPIRVPDMDAWHYEIISYFNMFCRSLRQQAYMTGGATP